MTKLLIRIQLGILNLQIFFLQNDIENGFGTIWKSHRLQQKKLMRSILRSFLKTGSL